MKTDLKTKAWIATGEGDAEKRSITSVDAFNEKVTEAAKDGSAAPRLIAKGTFQFSYAETVDEALALSGGSEEILLSHFNYAAALRQSNASTDVLQEEGYVEQEGAVDMAFSIAQKTERKKMTSEEKASKDLGIPLDLLRQALEIARAQQAQTATA
jgi:hypothetical protein